MTYIQKEHLHDAVICYPDDSVLEVARIMRDTQTRYVLVVDRDHKPLGLISPFDIVKRAVAEEKNVHTAKASEIMSHPVVTVELGESYVRVAEKMTSLETFRIPVVAHGKVVGILNVSSEVIFSATRTKLSPS